MLWGLALQDAGRLPGWSKEATARISESWDDQFFIVVLTSSQTPTLRIPIFTPRDEGL